MKLPAELPSPADVEFYSALSGIIGHLLLPSTVYAILRGARRRAQTKTFAQMPIEAYGGQYPWAMLDDDERDAETLFDDRTSLPSKRLPGSKPAVIQTGVETFGTIINEQVKNGCE
jgi:hypothetical protein